MNTQSNTRFGRKPADIAQDFAEHLKYSEDADVYHTSPEGRYNAIALTIRDRIIQQWETSRRTQRAQDSKRVYYLSLEFLMGRAMTNNIINLGLEKEVREALASIGYTYEELADVEPDAGLGNGGLGRLAACFMDSLATLEYPAYGYGIRYNYGIFRQQIVHGYQVEQPDDWLRDGNPWEIQRPDTVYPVQYGGKVEMIQENGRDCYKWIPDERVLGMAYDTPIIGYGAKTVNTLRLWSAKATAEFNFKEFDQGDYTQAVRDKIQAETLSEVLYPNDTLYLGKELRLKQQYFFVTCSLQDIIRRFKRHHSDWSQFPDCAAIQMNDTHPSLAVPELMRLLVDEENLDWEPAWDITVRTLGYTNHTLMPEALEKWSLPMFEKLLPRHLQIIYEINRRFLQKAVSFFPMQGDKLAKVNIIEESDPKQIRMANLAIIGSHSTNGVAALHSELLKTKMFPEFNLIFPERFNNKTNGITQRRWLLDANPALASLITSAIGDGWITDFSQIGLLKPFAKEPSFLEQFAKIKQQTKADAAACIRKDCGHVVNPGMLFDTQVKRIHEYKRQLLNILHVVLLYNDLKNHGEMTKGMTPTTFFFAGKSAPGYVNAKLIIKFINNVSKVVNSDPETRDQLQVFFLPNYRVTLAEHIIPASNISEQISTAGTEASGTGNMKFMINGALTMGTLDGANVEMAEAAGRENMFIFGHTEEEIAALAGTYDPWEWINKDDGIKAMVELVRSGFFNVNEQGIFDPLWSSLFDQGDRYFLFADLAMYRDEHRKALELYRDNQHAWNEKAVLNIASSAKFSSDRTIDEYANEIWHLKKCPVPQNTTVETALLNAKSLKH